jgi:hypothetical protein
MKCRLVAVALGAAALFPWAASAQADANLERARELRAAGKPAEAAALLRTQLAANPNDGRARLQLAFALEDAGDLLAARYHLELALGADLSAAEKEQALIALRKIRERSTTSSFFVTSLAPVKSRTVVESDGSSRTVGGESSYGLGVSGAARVALGEQRKYFARGSVDWRDYSGRLDDFLFGQASGGRVWSIERAALTAEIGALASAYQGRHWYTGGLVQLGETFYFNAQTTIGTTLLARRIEFTDLKGATANQGYLFSDIRWARPAALTFSLGGTAGTSNARDEWRGFNYGELRGSVLKELPRGWIVELRGAAGLTRYAAVEPGFATTRRDTSGSVGVDLTWREFTVFRLAPRVSVSRVQVDSNLAAYDSSRNFFVFGLTSSY